MQLVGIVVVLIGAYLVNSSVQNRPPIRTIKALIADPSDLTGTLHDMEGKWQGSTIITSDSLTPDPAADAKQQGNSRNGRLSDSELQSLSWAPTKKLRPDAANALEELNRHYRARFGRNISVTDAYRTYAQQVAVKAAKPHLAATPGTSNHGLGIAVDLGGGVNQFDTAQYAWMAANAPRFGWRKPSWSVKGGSKPEPWHWEYGSG